jgi:hypothetical protein
MKTLKQFLSNPVAQAFIILAACIYILNSTADRFWSEARQDRDDMVASLRQAQTPEPQIAAISKGFDRITSDVSSMAMTFFSFTSVVLVAAFVVRRRSEPPRQDVQQQPHGELRHEHVA